MKKLLHARTDAFTAFFKQLSQLNQLYIAKNPDLFDKTAILLQALAPYLEQEGFVDSASKVRCMESELETVKRGFMPSTIVKMETPKRELQFALTSNIIITANDIITNHYQHAITLLQDARNNIQSIVLVAIQNKFIDISQFPNNITQAIAEQVWDLFATHDVLSIIQQKALLSVHKMDCLIILEQTLETLKNN